MAMMTMVVTMMMMTMGMMGMVVTMMITSVTNLVMIADCIPSYRFGTII